MRIAIGADHAGYDLKQHLATVLHNLGHTVFDLGTDGTTAVD
ncbi:RpiB/LacA/LacB family sugar-phosphate isomerase, partial [Streptomyces niveiscabiei]